MDDDVLDDLVVLLPPLLRSLEALSFVARHLNPRDLPSVMDAVGAPDEALRAARSRLDNWPEPLMDVRARLETASDAVLAAFDGLHAASHQGGGMRAGFAAMRHAPRAQEALYPLAAGLPPVSRFFLDPALRDNADLQARLAQAPASENTGVIQTDDPPGARGGYSMYVPEYYTPDRPWPLVMALHGGGGDGRGLLWSWLRETRGQGAILVTPTAIGEAWALDGPDIDTPNLDRILDRVRGRWNVDPARLLLTGMSDGGTFTYVSGLEPQSPFTHLAPISASFHPLLAQMADPDRMRDLPIYLVHGAMDWMFPVVVAREARQALTAAGARVTYREIEDLGHCYPREVNPDMLEWLGEGGAQFASDPRA